MMVTIQSFADRLHRELRRLSDPRVRQVLGYIGWAAAGFFLSAASLGNVSLPLTLGLVCCVPGLPGLLTALGGCLGYLVFWGGAGLQGPVWLGLGLLVSLTLGDRQIVKDTPFLLPVAAGLITALTGLGFQIWFADSTPPLLYLLRTVIAVGAARLAAIVTSRREPFADWLACGTCVLALAQVAPLPWMSLGYLAAGALGAAGAFPAAALAGLALDLSDVTQVPMTAVLCLAFFLRLVPTGRKWARLLLPALVFMPVMALSGTWDLAPLPGLFVGGLAGYFLPSQPGAAHRRGEAGVAQVRLEMAGTALSQMQQLLLEAPQSPIDAQALVQMAASRACGGCPCRKSCQEQMAAAALPSYVLEKPLIAGEPLGIHCRKEGRLLQELRRSQEQLRTIRASRREQQEYRWAVVQQYRFLSEYLQDLSDDLSRRMPQLHPRFTAEVAFAGNRAQKENGDRCLRFAGTGCRYYVALCDGMGTGAGAVDEGDTAADLLKKLLTAGYPASHALRSLNSLCALRGRAGSVTIDLAELQLDTGKAVLYKWGAAPSYLITAAGTEKIGTAGPPPGLSVTDGRETAERLSLRQGEILALVSDGVGGEDALRCLEAVPGEPLGETAARVLGSGNLKGTDDATAAIIRLARVPQVT